MKKKSIIAESLEAPLCIPTLHRHFLIVSLTPSQNHLQQAKKGQITFSAREDNLVSASAIPSPLHVGIYASFFAISHSGRNIRPCSNANSAPVSAVCRLLALVAGIAAVRTRLRWLAHVTALRRTAATEAAGRRTHAAVGLLGWVSWRRLAGVAAWAWAARRHGWWTAVLREAVPGRGRRGESGVGASRGR